MMKGEELDWNRVGVDEYLNMILPSGWHFSPSSMTLIVVGLLPSWRRDGL